MVGGRRAARCCRRSFTLYGYVVASRVRTAYAMSYGWRQVIRALLRLLFNVVMRKGRKRYGVKARCVCVVWQCVCVVRSGCSKPNLIPCQHQVSVKSSYSGKCFRDNGVPVLDSCTCYSAP